jgi:hypothetical protein
LIINPLINYFGIDNIGFITINQNSQTKPQINKKIYLFDGFRYNLKFEKNLLKLIKEQFTTDNIVFQNFEMTSDLNVIIISNEVVNDKKKINEKILKTFKGQFDEIIFLDFKKIKIEKCVNLNVYTFNQTNEKIKNEEAEIMIYCNQQYFSNLLKNN